MLSTVGGGGGRFLVGWGGVGLLTSATVGVASQAGMYWTIGLVYKSENNFGRLLRRILKFGT